MKILGLNVYHADTAATIIVDGKIIAASEEERFTRIKHFTGFPYNSINFCLKEADLKLSEIDFVSVNYNFRYNFFQRLKFLLSNIYAENLISKLLSLRNKKTISNLFKDYYGINIDEKIIFVPHHLSHIASSFLTSGFENAIGLSIDATGDFSSMEISTLKNFKDINILHKTHFPHSIGILYQTITQFLGFKKYGDEYKIMALASYGKPSFIKEFDKLIEFHPPFEFKLDLNYFVHQRKFFFKEGIGEEPYFDNLFSKNIEKLLGPARNPKDKIEERHKDIACSLQYKFEEIIIKIINNLYIENFSENICISGGCMFNSVLNGRLIQETKFENFHLHSNVGDAGGSIGSALYTSSKKNNYFKNKKFTNNYLGPKYSDTYIEECINKNKSILHSFNIKKYENFNDIYKITSSILNDGKIVGWFQDEMEWGPRALGNRSILVDPRLKNAKDLLNTKIKLREEFRPFAASILENYLSDLFLNNSKLKQYPHMNFIFKAKEETKKKYSSIVHVDGSTRIQTVNDDDNSKFYNLLQTFNNLYSVPLLLNTSLNINEPICESPDDVIKSFATTNIDCIILQNFILTK